jgi:hypothetical protein
MPLKTPEAEQVDRSVSLTVSSALVNVPASHLTGEFTLQLMIDILSETPEALDLAAQFLHDHARLRRVMEGAANVPTGTKTEPSAPFVAPAAVAPSAPTPPVTAPPAPSNVVPLVPTSAHVAATPGTSALASPSSAATASPGVSAAPPAGDVYDRAGVPWDARIHQEKRGQKKDGTWKLKKGVDDAIVSVVMQELAPRIRAAQPAAPTTPAAPPAPPAEPDPATLFGHTPLPAGASAAPVSLPPIPPVTVTQTPAAPPAPTTQTPAAPPAPPAETVAPQADPFRALVRKVTEARNTKPAPRISAEEVTQCCAAAGVPGLQALNAMPHLIATVEANIDALLATR